MTETEMHAEFGRLLHERAAIKQAIACLDSKLRRAERAFRMAATAIDAGTEWALPDTVAGGLAVPVSLQSWPEEEHTLPPLDDLARWLREKKVAAERLAEINETLPD